MAQRCKRRLDTGAATNDAFANAMGVTAMRRYRTFSDTVLKPGGVVELDDRETRHIGSVLRVREGDEVIVVNGRGIEAIALVIGSGKALKLRISEVLRSEKSPESPRLVACALTKSSAFEEMLTHATELGMTTFLPLVTKRTIVELDERREEKKREKWRAIATDALKQCERLWLPAIESPLSPKDALTRVLSEGYTPVLLQERGAAPPLRSVLATLETAPAFFVGPEGGWTPEEIEALLAGGAVGASLGAAILRTETAVLAALALTLE